MNIPHHPLSFLLLIFISGFIIIVTNAESNQSCGNTRVPYPFGFSHDSQIRLTCTNGGEVKINDFTVINFTSDSIRLNFPAVCNRSINSIHQLISKHYALTWRNSLLLQDCTSPLNDCVIPASMLENRFQLQSCDNSLTNATINCYSQTYGGGVEFMDYSTLIANCRVLHSSIVLDLDGNMSSSGGGSTNVSLDFQTVELGWWVDGGCRCVKNANCTVVTSPDRTVGSRCRCLGGFEGDGFADGDGCRRG